MKANIIDKKTRKCEDKMPIDVRSACCSKMSPTIMTPKKHHPGGMMRRGGDYVKVFISD